MSQKGPSKKNKDAGEKNRDFLARAYEIARLGSWELDLSAGRLTWSEEIYKIFGVNPGEFNGTYSAFLDYVHPDDRQMVNEAYSVSLEEDRDGYELEHRIIRKDTGETRYVHEKCLHERDREGKIVRSVGIVQDITERKRAEKDLEAIVEASSTILTIEDFPTAARRIFDSLAGLVGSTAGYVALLSEDGKKNELLFLESGGRSCSVNPDLPMPIRGLRVRAYAEKRVVYDNDFMNSQWIKYMPEGHVRLDNVLFAPLVLEDRTVGIIGLANKPGGFTGHDAYLAKVFGNLAAISLRNSGRLEKLRERSRSDVLTGCLNRRGGVGCLDHELARVGRTDTPLAVIMFDIDHFKTINDSYGHDTGDQVLQEIAEVAMKNMREADILIRWGGEEFLVVAPDTDMETAAILVERLRKTIAGNKFSGTGKITASFGIAQYQKGDRRDGLIDRADRYMYLAKQKGRNRVEAGE